MKVKRGWQFVGMLAISVVMTIILFVYAQGAESSIKLDKKVQVGMTTYAEEADLTISSARELKEFAQKVNNGNSYKGKLVRLSADIQFDGVTVNNFTPIGDTYGTRFEGIFDGCRHTVSGIIVINNSDMADAVGLFGYLGEGAMVKNINIKDSEFTNNNTSATTAAVIGFNMGTVNNCHNRNVKINSSGYYSGGIVGKNRDDALVINCSSAGEVISTCTDFIAYTGGVVGNNEGTICNSCNIGNVKSVNGVAGGITGGDNIAASVVQNSYNTGIIISDNDKSGGIVGEVRGIVANCYCSEESASANFYCMNGNERNCRALPVAEMQTMSFMNQLNNNRGDNEEWLEWEICLEESIYPFPTRILIEEPTTGNDSTIKYGDVNGDGEIKIGDGVMLKKHLAAMPVKINQAASDVNVDGDINITDAVLLMKYLAGMDVKLGVA